MTAATLHHLTIDVLENQRRTAKTVLAAMRHGYARAHGSIDSAWERGLEFGLVAKMSDELKSSLLGAEKKLTGAAMGSVDTVTTFIDSNVDRAYDLATDGLRSERAQKLYDTRAYGVVSQASLPLAKLSVKVSATVAEGVEKLAVRVQPSDVAKAADKVVTRAKRAAKTVKAKVERAAAEPRRTARTVVAKARRRAAA